MPKIKIAFFDIDWTLYDHQVHRYIPSALQAIKKLQSTGVKVFLCSARPYDSMKSFGVFDLGIRWDGYIASAGAVAYYKHQKIKALLMPKVEVRNLMKVVAREGLTMELVGLRSRALTAKVDRYVEEYHKIYADIVPKVRPYKGVDVTGALLYSTKDYDEAIAKACPHLLFYRFCDYGVDVMDVPHEKGDAIKDVLNYLGLQKEEAVAFGDDFQDLSMIPQVGCFIAVGNGKDEVKKQANLVTDPIKDDGIAKALSKLSLI